MVSYFRHFDVTKSKLIRNRSILRIRRRITQVVQNAVVGSDGLLRIGIIDLAIYLGRGDSVFFTCDTNTENALFLIRKEVIRNDIETVTQQIFQRCVKHIAEIKLVLVFVAHIRIQKDITQSIDINPVIDKALKPFELIIVDVSLWGHCKSTQFIFCCSAFQNDLCFWDRTVFLSGL